MQKKSTRISDALPPLMQIQYADREVSSPCSQQLTIFNVACCIQSAQALLFIVMLPDQQCELIKILK